MNQAHVTLTKQLPQQLTQHPTVIINTTTLYLTTRNNRQPITMDTKTFTTND